MRNIHISPTMLRVLDAVAREASVTRAAECLNLTQSGVSHAIRAWADALGEPVVRRSGRTTELTPLGAEALREVRGALTHLNAISALVAPPELSGTIRLGCVASAAIAIVPPALERLRARYPQVAVDLIEGTDAEVADWFAAGITDMAIGMCALGTESTLLCPVELVGVIKSSDPLARAGALPAAALAERPFVMSSSGCEEAITDYVQETGNTLKIISRIRDTRALLAAIEAGHGVTILPALTVSSRSDKLTVRPLAPSLVRTLNIACRSGDQLYRVFEDILRGETKSAGAAQRQEEI